MSRNDKDWMDCREYRWDDQYERDRARGILPPYHHQNNVTLGEDCNSIEQYPTQNGDRFTAFSDCGRFILIRSQGVGFCVDDKEVLLRVYASLIDSLNLNLKCDPCYWEAYRSCADLHALDCVFEIIHNLHSTEDILKAARELEAAKLDAV